MRLIQGKDATRFLKRMEEVNRGLRKTHLIPVPENLGEKIYERIKRKKCLKIK